MSSPSGPASWLSDIALGAVAPGTNLPTFLALQVILLALLLSLVLLLAYALHAAAWLVPHALVLLVLTLGLWGLVIWVVGTVGLVAAEDQERELGGPAQGGAQPEAGTQGQQQEPEQDGKKCS